MRTPRTPERGDIYHLDLEPTRGREQRGRRPVFVLSPARHNRRGLVIVLPISRGVTLSRSTGFASTLMGVGLITQGVVICDHPRTVDFAARRAKYIESVPDVIIQDVLGRIAPLVA